MNKAITMLSLNDGCEARLVKRKSLLSALLLASADGFSPVSAPEFMNIRIAHPQDHLVWNEWVYTSSARFTGLSPAGNKVVVFVHEPNYLSNPANIALANYQGSVKCGAASVPDNLVSRFLMDEGKIVAGVTVVSVVDAADAARKSGLHHMDYVLDHSMIINYAGSRDIASRYLPRYKEVSGTSIAVLCPDDPINSGRLLLVGNTFSSSDFQTGSGSFLAVRP